MSRPTSGRAYKRPPRERARELLTFAVALLLTVVAGKVVLGLFHNPPALLQLAVFIVLYMLVYAALWRLGAQYAGPR